MSYTTLILPRLQVSNANALPHSWIIGAPAVTAYAGFAHALALALGAQQHLGVGIVHHDIQFLGEAHYGTLQPHQYRAAGFIDKRCYVGGTLNLALQPTARCHLNVSIAIRFNPDEPLDLDPRRDRVRQFLRGARLAGGSIIDHDFDIASPHCLLDEHSDASAITRAIGSGFGIHERQDLMVLGENDRDMLDTILRLTRPEPEKPADLAWLQPTALGFIQISDVATRFGARNNLPHAYAEPLIGLVQYRSIRKHSLPFWRYHCPSAGMFALTTHPNSSN